MIDYSVIIRTTGKANEKYQKLLSSISELNPLPKEVIVVLPEGNKLPVETLGWETFYYSPKGMVRQRMKGVSMCKTRYALICDDDIQFDTDFVKKLYEPIVSGLGSFAAGPLYSFLPPKGMNSLLCSIMLSAVPTIFNKDKYVTVLKSTGYSYNRNLEKGKFYETQSVAWTCFFADIHALKNINFEDELWLDKNGYSALDDQTMFYKAHLLGYKTIVVADAVYEHLDAKTSTINNQPAFYYSKTFNRVIFWHRFIYSRANTVGEKLLSKIMFEYRMLCVRMLDLLNVLRKRMSIEQYKISVKGYVDGKNFIKSNEYMNLSSI